MKDRKKLIFMTGGGTAGHITPNLALVEPLKEAGYEVMYLGRKGSMEYDMVTAAGIPFLEMNSGRVNRSLNPKMVLETLQLPGRVLQGIHQAKKWIRQEKPALIFCKGGFVSFPAAVAGKLTHTPVVLHESDLTPGLANKMCIPYANKICITFQETEKYLAREAAEGKVVYTGSPVRKELLSGSREEGYALTGLNPEGKPVLLIVGGSQGAQAINDCVREALPELLQHFQIVHLYGARSGYEVPTPLPAGYYALPFASGEMPDLYAMADLILGRAGANSINEFLLLEKPSVLVPLPLDASRGDQILNAQDFAARGYSHLLLQEDMTGKSLVAALLEVQENRDKYLAAMHGAGRNGTKELLKVILKEAENNS